MTDTDLRVALAEVSDQIGILAAKITLAGDLSKRQRRLTQIVYVVVCVALLQFVSLFFVSRAQCEAVNTANATNAQFWRSTITQFPSVPPGPDATQSEIDAYERGQARLDGFVVEVDRLGAPRHCP